MSSKTIVIDKLQGAENYNTWATRVKAYLTKLDLESAIEGNEEKCQKKAFAEIMLLCADGPLIQIQHCKNAITAWKKLKDLYNSDGFTSKFLLLRELFSSRLEEFDSVEIYLNKIKQIVNDLKAQECELPEEVNISWILFGLTEDFEGFVGNITQALRKDPKSFTFDSLCASLLDEARRLGVSTSGKPALFQLVSKKPWKKANKDKKPLVCSYCKLKGHSSESCYFIHPDKAPKTWKNKSKVEKPPPKTSNKAKEKREKQIQNLVAQRAHLIESEEDSSESDIESQSSESSDNMDIDKDEENTQILPLRFQSPLATLGEGEGEEFEFSYSSKTSEEEDEDREQSPLEEDSNDDEEFIDCIEVNNKSTDILNNITDNFDLDTRLKDLLERLEDGKRLSKDAYNNCFIVDTGAAVNAITNKSLFLSMKPVKRQVSWGKIKTINITGIGDVKITLYNSWNKTNNKTTNVILKNCVYIPDFGINIISVSAAKNIWTITTGQYIYLLCKNSHKILTQGEKISGLYYVPVITKDNKEIQLNTIKELSKPLKKKGNIDREILHKRFAHTHQRNLQKIVDNTESQYTYKEQKKNKNKDNNKNKNKNKDNRKKRNKINKGEQDPCEVCIKAHFRNKVFKKSTNKVVYNYLEKISSDLCGPFSTLTYNKYKYFITFLDKGSRYLEIKLLRTKKEVYAAFVEFKTRNENNKENKRIRIFQSDNGTEYVNRVFKAYLIEGGIIHQLSPANTKEPNGFPERINQTLLVKVRALLLNSGAPKYLWGEALESAVYIYNRTPHKSLNNKTPYELKNKVKPNIDNIKIWGSKAYYKIKGPNIKSKLDQQAEEAILIGYGQDDHLYKVFDITKQRAIWTRDIKILEDIYPQYKTVNNKFKNKTVDNTEKPLIEIDISEENNKVNSPEENNQVQIPEEDNNPRIVTRSQTARIDSADNITNNNSNITVDIPRKEDNYYKEFQVISSSQINHITDIFLIKDSNGEPNTYKQAIEGPDSIQWDTAMKSELQELETQNTWNIIDLPKDRKALGGRWVYKIKTNQNNEIVKYKARWVVQGFHQIEGIDYLETFSTVCRPETYRIIFGIAITNNWVLSQYDVKNAFVHAIIDTDIYVKLPTGFYQEYGEKVCKLKKALYGLKQSPRLWYKHLSKTLDKYNFTVFPYDEGAWVQKSEQIILLCHVDDFIVTGPNQRRIEYIMNKVSDDIKLQALGEINTFLGMDIKIDRKNRTLLMHQQKYINNILTKYNKDKLPPRKSPSRMIKLYKNEGKARYEDITQYQRYIGSLLYLALKTRPDIAYPVQYCAKYASNPSKEHFQAVDDIFGYLNMFPNQGMLYKCNNNIQNFVFKGYCDSDWANCLDTRRSTTGYITWLAGNIISWCVQLQKTVALSSTEAEYMAEAEVAKEVKYLQASFKSIATALRLNIPISIPAIMVDNNGAIKLANNPEFHKRTKHIDIRYHFIRELVESEQIRIIYVNTKENLADPLTKSIPTKQLIEWKDKIHITD